MIGISQDLYHAFNEENWAYARPMDLLLQWSQLPKTWEEYQQKKKLRPELTPISFFAEDLLNWEGMHCNSKEGCSNIPSQDDIIAKFPNDRHRARQINFAIMSIDSSYSQHQLISKLLDQVKERLSGYVYTLI
jgi:hypothetical protein